MKRYKKRIDKKNTSKSILMLLIFGFNILLFTGLSTGVYAASVDDFIPKDSLVFLKLQDIDEVYNEINTSETWKKAIDELTGESDFKGMKSRLLALESIIGIDVSGVIDAIGYQIGIALWKGELDTLTGGLVIHSGGNLKELQRLTKLITGFLGLSAGTLTLDAGQYLKVKYNTLEHDDLNLTYGFVGDLLIVGQGNISFEKLIETYRKKIPSIKKKDSYTKVSKKLGSGEVSLSLNVSGILPHLNDIDDSSREQFESFTNIHAKLNLLDTAPLLKFHTEINDKHLASKITPFLKEGDELKILNSMSGTEDLFVAFAPIVLETVWQLIQEEIQNSETDDVHAFLTFLEGLLNLNFEEDVIAALTGEIALSIDNLSLFEPSALESLDINIDNSVRIDAANVHTHGGIIFIPKKPSKWNQIGNSLSNLQNSSVSNFDYKNKKISVFGSNIYYAENDGLALLSFSEDQMYSLVDRIVEKKKVRTIKRLPKSPLFFVHLNIVKLLHVLMENVHHGNEENQHEMFPLFAWLTVDDNTAMLEVVLSDKESPIEVFGKIAPLIVPTLLY